MSTHYDLIRTALADAVFARIPWNAQNADAVLDERAKKLESDLIALAVQPAPVSATERDAVREEFRETYMVGLVKHSAFPTNNTVDEIIRLRARLAEAERVTEWTDAQVDAVCESLFGEKGYHRDRVRAALTAARGGG